MNCFFLVNTKRCICLNKSCVRSFAGCVYLNLAGLCWVSCRKFSDAVKTIFSGQSVISRVYTLCFGNGAMSCKWKSTISLWLRDNIHVRRGPGMF